MDPCLLSGSRCQAIFISHRLTKRTPWPKATLAALVIGPEAFGAKATTATTASVQLAFAKPDHANSKPEGNCGKSENAREKSGERGKSSERSASRGKSFGGVEGFFAKLAGQDKRVVKEQRSAKPSVIQNTAKVEKVDRNRLHPSQPGNMNSGLNANINAVLAHIRSGNASGPDDQIAVLMTASDAADSAQGCSTRSV